MKVIEKFEIGYFVPETDEECAEIQGIITDFEGYKNRKIDYSKLVLIDNRNKLKNGFWRKL